MSKKMDDARRASRDRDAVQREDPMPARAGVQKSGGRFPRCPECRHSVAFLHWNPARDLWECHGCGFTATPAEL